MHFLAGNNYLVVFLLIFLFLYFSQLLRSHLECLASSFKQLEGTLRYLNEFVEMDTR
jgi:hypothetical protein